MSESIVYRLEFVNVENNTVRVDFADTSSPDTTGDPEIIPMLGGASPMSISVVDTSEDKFIEVLAKRLTVNVVTNNLVNASAFADGPDNRWRVTATLNPDGAGFVLFKGFVVMSEIEQDYLPDPVNLKLTASDQLGLLKDLPLKTLANDVPRGKYKVAALVAMCLNRTGQALPINVIDNLRHGCGEIEIDFANFSNSSSTIFFPSSSYTQFYPGQEITIDSTGLNDGETFTVVVNNGGANIEITPAPIAESGITNFSIIDESSNGHWWDKVYLDALTFEAEIGECQDCYTVLEKIFGSNTKITQYNGQWWILRTDEYDGNPFYVASFATDGTYSSIGLATDMVRSIGKDQDFKVVDRQDLLRFQRICDFIKNTFRYEYPKEIVCNIDFSRGITVITPPDLTAAESIGVYELDCWTLKRLFDEPITSEKTVERRFEYGYEKDRYAVISPATSTATPFDYIECEPIPIRKRDKVSVSVDFRWRTNFGSGTGGSTYYPLRIYILDDNGDYWYWWHPSSTDINDFYWTGPETSEIERTIPVTWSLMDADQTEWRTISVELDPAPANGLLYIGLNHLHQGNDSGDNQDAFYSNLSVTYTPLINGSYREYNGDYDKVTNLNSGYTAKRDVQVYLRDAPVKLFKGAMFLLNQAAAYVLTSTWYTAAPFALGPVPGGEFLHPYGWQQAFAVWNQFNRNVRKFSVLIKGLGESWPDTIHKYERIADDTNAANRYFIVTSFEQDWKFCTTNLLLIEVYNSDPGKVYNDTHEFKYIDNG